MSVDALARRRLVMEVDLEAVAQNARVAIAAGDGRRNIIAVLKGDAYGMGARVLAPHLRAAGITRFATDNVAEAVALRRAGVADSVLVLYGEPPELLHAYVDHDLMPVIHDAQQAAACAAAAKARGVALQVWLGANVGFNRAGAPEQAQFGSLLDAVAGHQQLRVVGVLAHLTGAHVSGHRIAAETEAFDARVAAARRRLGGGLQTSLFASHALLRWGSRDEADWVRPGLMLCGEHCFGPDVLRADARAADLASQLRPAVEIRARVIHLLETRSPQRVGYAPGVPVAGRRRLATVALGFRSGFPIDGDAPVVCRGRLAERVGPMGMDSFQVDVTDLGDVEVGDWVTLCGRDGARRVSLAHTCTASGVSPYQLLARLRIPRTYRRSQDMQPIPEEAIA